MPSRTGRTRLAFVLCALTLAFGPAPSARAQDALAQARRPKKKRRPRVSPVPATDDSSQPGWEETEEEDPEDGDSAAEDAPAAETGSAASSDGEMVINDPELEERAGTMSDDRGWGGMVPETQASHSTASSADEYDPQANTGIARLELIGQQGVDIRHEGDLEDAYESRLRFDAEVDFRRSRKLRMSVGVRTDLLWALPARGDKALFEPSMGANPARNNTPFDQDRWELDIIPLSAFVDTTLGSAFHLRIGVQPVSIRRMDFYSPIDILAAFDWRGQPKLDPASGRLAQPAVRVDWDLSSWATLQVVYVPWFMPNLTRPNRDRYVATKLGTRGAQQSRTIEDLIDPSYEPKISENAFRFVGPAPDFTHPQAQTRLTMRGSSFELGLSAGTALEKIPSTYITPKTEAYFKGDRIAAQQVLFAIGASEPLIDFAYHRYALFGLDGSVDLSPLSLGFELAFSPSRHLTAATMDGSHLPQPNVSKQILDTQNGIVSNVKDKSIRKGVPLLQAAFHVDWIKGERFAIAAEAFVVKAMKLPYDLDRDWWGFIPGKALYAGGLVGGSFQPNPDTGRLRFDLSLVSLVGPSFIVMPQVELKAMDGLYLNLGAQIFEGPAPGDGGAQNVNVGGLFSGYDQVFLGFRYLP